MKLMTRIIVSTLSMSLLCLTSAQAGVCRIKPSGLILQRWNELDDEKDQAGSRARVAASPSTPAERAVRRPRRLARGGRQ